jgi:hypothetical protein
MRVDIGFNTCEAGPMRHVFFSVAAIALAATFATSGPSYASAGYGRGYGYAPGGTIACSEPGGPCASGSARSYNSCVDLALQRGENLGKGGRRSLDLFVYQCLAGRIPR